MAIAGRHALYHDSGAGLSREDSGALATEAPELRDAWPSARAPEEQRQRLLAPSSRMEMPRRRAFTSTSPRHRLAAYFWVPAGPVLNSDELGTRFSDPAGT